MPATRAILTWRPLSRRLQSPQLIALLAIAIGLRSAAADETPHVETNWQGPPTDSWTDEVPTIIKAVNETESMDPSDDPTSSNPGLASLDDVLIEPEAISIPEMETVEVGRSYNAPGWYSFPEWGRMTWRPQNGDRIGAFAMEGVDTTALERWNGLSYTDGTGFHFLGGPSRTDLPPRLFDFNWGLHWFAEVGTGWWADLAFSAGIHTDFEDSSREGWRIPAHAVITRELTPEVEPVVGLRYFDRANLGLLPVAGVILRPDEGVRLEFVFPEPRISCRVNSDEESEHWLSLSGRIGGGEWAIERSNTGFKDVVTYNDYEIVFGFEEAVLEGTISSFEIGVLVDRELRYRSRRGNFQPKAALFLRYATRK